MQSLRIPLSQDWHLIVRNDGGIADSIKTYLHGLSF